MVELLSVGHTVAHTRMRREGLIIAVAHDQYQQLLLLQALEMAVCKANNGRGTSSQLPQRSGERLDLIITVPISELPKERQVAQELTYILLLLQLQSVSRSTLC